MSRPDWIYDPSMDFWFLGEENNGCGVGTDDGGKTYYANVVKDGKIVMLSIPDYNSLEEAQLAAELEYFRDFD